jgi:hypothetical protein
MRCGILIIGSLLWDSETKGRADWRAARLDVGAQAPMRAPIYYGRKSSSRGNTYTMTFRPERPSGQAVLVPCKRQIKTIDDLVAEANALWKAEAPKAEAPKAKRMAICSNWGCVGALFGTDRASKKLAPDWTAHFRKVGAQGLSVIKPNGLLDISWPNGLDGEPADFDIILATATEPESDPPAAHRVADAWIGQDHGYERYFLENVRHGIRTEEDLQIWRRIECAAPRWLKVDAYKEAVAILRDETQEHDQQ